jgi:NAD(P)-dependent dehydrogenase (short-subunit alcohol dehydrogenase family)
MTRHVIDGMRARSFGRIINVSSINGRKGQMGQTNYSAAKAGMHGFTKALAFERRGQGHHRQHHRAGLHRHRDGARRAEGSARHQDHPAIPVGRLGESRRSRVLWCSSPPTAPASSTAPASTSTAATTWPPERSTLALPNAKGRAPPGLFDFDANRLRA